MPRKTRRPPPETPPESLHPCQAPGCRAAGEYKAPKSRSELHRYEWYCLEHIREYNSQWDFFSGMDRREIEAFMKEALTGHRPTWTREGKGRDYHDQLHEALREFFQIPPGQSRPRPPSVTASVKKAMAILDMDYPYTEQALKKQYRGMVKKHHPDVNRGDREAEERFKEITAAYLCLCEHLRAQ